MLLTLQEKQLYWLKKKHHKNAGKNISVFFCVEMNVEFGERKF